MLITGFCSCSPQACSNIRHPSLIEAQASQGWYKHVPRSLIGPPSVFCSLIIKRCIAELAKNMDDKNHTLQNYQISFSCEEDCQLGMMASACLIICPLLQIHFQAMHKESMWIKWVSENWWNEQGCTWSSLHLHQMQMNFHLEQPS